VLSAMLLKNCQVRTADIDAHNCSGFVLAAMGLESLPVSLNE
jgi:hypothetical protein